MGMITAVAIRVNNNIYSLPKPNRHGALFKYVKENLAIVDYEHGFMTSEGNFVGREEAAKMALECGQIKTLRHPGILYSEDLW